MKKVSILACLLVALAALMFWVTKADAYSSYYSSSPGNCQSCHGSVSTCNGCHAHGVHSSSAKNTINVTGATNKMTYAPGETVSVTIRGGYRTGWVRAILYDQNMNELARGTGPTGEGGGPAFPVTLTAPAPMTAGSYTWNVSWYGNRYDTGSALFGARWTPDPNNPDHGQEIVSTNSFTVQNMNTGDKIGVFSNGAWYMDMDSNGMWNGGSMDNLRWFGSGLSGTVPVTGDWTGSGTTKIGVFTNGTWYLDLNGNGAWDGTPTDALYYMGSNPGAIPVTGDWTGTGTAKIGVYVNGMWYLDLNGNGVWDDTPTDRLIPNFGAGLAGAVPVTGKWTGTGATKIGVFMDGMWYLDLNGDGAWNGTPTDALYYFGQGIAGALPVTGDWAGNGTTRIGVYQNGTVYRDMDGNGTWNGTPTDVLNTFGSGLTGAVPVAGKW